mmetsp:Transcript_14403/g.25140  ORF Transcript_14403/g.25140 Transcript_14403/m.25140 type:complete len:208 (-) Transcript_14403:1948-2571(-)
MNTACGPPASACWGVGATMKILRLRTHTSCSSGQLHKCTHKMCQSCMYLVIPAQMYADENILGLQLALAAYYVSQIGQTPRHTWSRPSQLLHRPRQAETHPTNRTKRILPCNQVRDVQPGLQPARSRTNHSRIKAKGCIEVIHTHKIYPGHGPQQHTKLKECTSISVQPMCNPVQPMCNLHALTCILHAHPCILHALPCVTSMQFHA